MVKFTDKLSKSIQPKPKKKDNSDWKFLGQLGMFFGVFLVIITGIWFLFEKINPTVKTPSVASVITQDEEPKRQIEFDQSQVEDIEGLSQAQILALIKDGKDYKVLGNSTDGDMGKIWVLKDETACPDLCLLKPEEQTNIYVKNIIYLDSVQTNMKGDWMFQKNPLMARISANRKFAIEYR